jgi:MoaA/NifB/PqqE/SkfB family radical SAM enzyme
MNQARLAVFPGSLEYRFATPGRVEPSAPVPIAQILAQARAMDAERCQRLVIAGESPVKHPDFVALATECRRLGFKRIAMETDAAPLARRGMVTVLGRLGITQLLVVMGGLSEASHDAVLQEPGTLPAALEGLQRVIAPAGSGGPDVYLVAPVLRGNVDDLDPLLDWALGLPGRLQGFLLALPEIARVPAEYRHLLLPYAAQAQIAARLFRKCQGHNVEYGFTTKRGIIPCAAAGALDHFGTVFHDRFQYLQHTPSQQDEEFARIDACATCSLSTSCDGIERAYVDQFGSADLAPVPLDVAMSWKLRRINTLERFEYRNISPFQNDSPVNPRGLIRVNGHCNMSCGFCFVDRTVPDVDVAQLQEETRRMARGGTRHLVLSGGEPTLHPQLADLIRFAKALGAFDVIEMQTNGVKCAEIDYARELVAAGLNKVTVSLHSTDPDRSDTITRLPKAFGKTLQAIHNFRQLGILTQIAHVISKANYAELPDTVRYLRREFPADGGHLSLCLAIAQEISDLVFEWVTPTFSEIKPFVSNALDFCLETGIGFGGMIGQGGYPPCMLDGDMRYYGSVLDKVFKSADASEQFYKAERCRECSFDPYCLGPRRSYVEHYGDAEVKPFRAEIAPTGRRDRATGAEYSAEAAQGALAESRARQPAATAPVAPQDARAHTLPH